MWHEKNIPFEQARRVYISVGRQPGWVLRTALYAGATVMLLIALLLIVPAIVVGLVVFALLSLFHRIKSAVRGVIPRNDGRRNVTIIRRDDSGEF